MPQRYICHTEREIDIVFLYLNSIEMEFCSFLLLILFGIDFCFPDLGAFNKYYPGYRRWKKLDLPHYPQMHILVLTPHRN